MKWTHVVALSALTGLVSWPGCGKSTSQPGSDAAADAAVRHDAAPDGTGKDAARDATGADTGTLDTGARADGYADGETRDARLDSNPDSSPGDGAFPCDPTIGFPQPVPTCSQADPCTELLASYRLVGITEISTPSDRPICSTSLAALGRGRPWYSDGPPETWTDADGIARYSCEFRPEGTSPSAQRPLVVFIAGSGGTARGIYTSLSLRTKAPAFDLSGDPSRPGFILVASQARHLHWPTESPEDGTKHDIYHRDLASPSTNRDVAFLDATIDRLVSEGVVDTSRIYLMGWSNGGRFTALYGVARHGTATPGGSKVAAVAIYSGGDPFENIQVGYQPSCKLATYPSAALPYYMISRSCDGVMCNTAHAEASRALGRVVTPGNIASEWIATLQSEIGASVTWQLIDDQGVLVDSCTPTADCTSSLALLNHLRWPDGVDDGGGIDHEPAMLNFLRNHPRP